VAPSSPEPHERGDRNRSGEREGMGQGGEEDDEGIGEGREDEGGEAERPDASAGLRVGHDAPPAVLVALLQALGVMSCALRCPSAAQGRRPCPRSVGALETLLRAMVMLRRMAGSVGAC